MRGMIHGNIIFLQYGYSNPSDIVDEELDEEDVVEDEEKTLERIADDLEDDEAVSEDALF